ncbi:MAG: hypothetical protein WDN08_06660 [Rhizomicrobium sp.]
MYIFYFKDVLGYSQEASTILLVFYILIGVAGAPVTAWWRSASASTAP